MERIMDLFDKNTISANNSAIFKVGSLFKQQHDWTCSIACIRTILSGFGINISENHFIQQYNLIPSPYFSKDIYQLHILDDYQTIYGFNHPVSFDKIIEYLNEGYGIMIETMFSVSHWYCLLAYYHFDNGDIEKDKVLIYDPYYDRLQLLILDEIIDMWRDGINKDIINDFIAIKK